MPAKRSKKQRPAAPRQNPTLSPRGRHWAAVALIFGLCLIVYGPAMSAGTIWDDDGHITSRDLQSFDGLYRIWFDVGATQQYYPLLYSAFWLEHQLWGDWPAGYHIINIVQHAAAAVLVMLVLRELPLPAGTPLAAALVFAVHPVMVETVAWISEQKNTLSAVFYLSATLVYLRFDRQRKASRYALASGLFVLGLLSKTVVR